MRATKYLFTVSAILLLVLFMNGIYVLSKPGESEQIPVPVPISYPDGQISTEPKHGSLESSIIEEFPLNLMVLGLDRDGTRCDVIMLFNFEPGLSQT